MKLKFSRNSAEIFVPDGRPLNAALRRVTHLGVGAHQDDLEFMAFHGIQAGFATPGKAFGGVTCTQGGGSARKGPYQGFSDKAMQSIRRKEQNQAASVGRYAFMVQLDHPSKTVKDPRNTHLQEDLAMILEATRPQVVYTHNLADKHDTHIAVAVAALQALGTLPPRYRPAQVIGCEVWRSLDWLMDSDKVIMNVSGQDHLAAALNGLFDSQIGSGKRYDLATMGRRAANATFLESHSTDGASQVILGMDLTPLVRDTTLDMVDFVTVALDRFREDVRARLRRQLGRPG